MRHNTFKLALALVACLSVFSLAQTYPAIPVLEITTQNGQAPGEGNTSCGAWGCGGGMWGGTTTNYNYVKVTGVKLTGARNNFDFTRPQNREDSIRIRGNSTAGTAKKPYRIKFADKVSMFGREAHRSWVLLANFYDGTFALNAIAFKLGQQAGLDFTPHSEFVEVKLNGQSKGFYQLTEQMQVNSGRVDIREKKDWFAEFDYHDADADEVKFNTTRYNLPTFIKSPEIESGSYNVNNPAVKFAVDEINALTVKMSESGFPTNGYRDLMDLNTWAKYVLIQQLMDNLDFNSKVASQNNAPGSNFCYRDSTGKIKAGPLWDFDLSAGVTENGFPRHYQTYQEPIKPRHPFYQRLWEDPVFLACFKKAWNTHENDFKAISTSNGFLDSIAGVFNNKIGTSNLWANNQMMAFQDVTLTQQQFNSEINSLKTWWTNRVNWFGQQLNNMGGIDVSNCVETTNTVTVVFDANGGSPTPATQTVTIGQKATKPNNPTRNGCTFDDWYTDGGNSTGTFVDKWNFNTAVTGKLTLYAKWNGNNCGGNDNPQPPQPNNSFTVTFNALSGSAQPVPNAQTVASGAKATEPAAMTRQPTGTWTFAGWYKDQGTWQQKWNFATDVVTSDVTLYAYWKSTVSYTVTFNTNGGSSVPTQSITEGEKATQPTPDPTRSGFVFSGWYRDAAFNNVWNFDADVVSAATTIYAKWTSAGQETYTVTFNSNGGTIMPSTTVNKGEKVTEPANPVRSGYVFDGWYKDRGLTTRWNFGADVVNENTTIHAKWSQQTSPIIAVRTPSLGSGTLTAIKNGLAINATSNISLTIFNLNGNVVRKQTLNSGNHTVKFEDLPKGMYIVRATFGKGTTPVTMRLPIR